MDEEEADDIWEVLWLYKNPSVLATLPKGLSDNSQAIILNP